MPGARVIAEMIQATAVDSPLGDKASTGTDWQMLHHRFLLLLFPSLLFHSLSLAVAVAEAVAVVVAAVVVVVSTAAALPPEGVPHLPKAPPLGAAGLGEPVVVVVSEGWEEAETRRSCLCGPVSWRPRRRPGCRRGFRTG